MLPASLSTPSSNPSPRATDPAVAGGDRERWTEKWSGRGVGTSHGSALVDLIGDRLPTSGRALDVGGGGSTDSLELAHRGLDVTVVDVSDVGLAASREQAAAEGLSVHTVQADLDTDPLPNGRWDLIVIANYLQRGLLAEIAAVLAPSGLLAVVIATVTNLERSDRPSRPFLVEQDELPTLVGDLEILHHTEMWRPNGRHEAHLLARRRQTGS